MSKVWNYFTKSDKTTAKCKICSSYIKITGGNTSALWRHSSTHITLGIMDMDVEAQSTNAVERETQNSNTMKQYFSISNSTDM